MALNPQGAQAQECTLVHDPLALWDQVILEVIVVPAPTTVRQPPLKDPQTGYSKIVPQSGQKYRPQEAIKHAIRKRHLAEEGAHGPAFEALSKPIVNQPALAFSGEERYLTPLWVSRKGNELYESDPSQDGFELSKQTIHDKMEAVLKKLTFREQKVIVQFWSPRVVGKHRLLTTIDQPFGLGVFNDEGLYLYRRDSEHKFYDVDKDHDAEDLSPPARVFMRGLPEWTSDVTNYLPKDFPLQECAMQCNLHRYLGLPVFNLTTGSRVGVIELLTSSKHPSFAYEVQQFHRALKTQNMTCRQVSDAPVSDVINEGRRNELDNIFGILSTVCDYYRLPLAQTWGVIGPNPSLG
ncbi:hypothetical protein Tco_0452574 [Tanacetum coccineum]